MFQQKVRDAEKEKQQMLEDLKQQLQLETLQYMALQFQPAEAERRSCKRLCRMPMSLAAAPLSFSTQRREAQMPGRALESFNEL
eukprot:s393_g36.t1